MNFLNPYDKDRRLLKDKLMLPTKLTEPPDFNKRKLQEKPFRKSGIKFISEYNKQLQVTNKKFEQEYKEYIKSIKVGKDAMKEVEEVEQEEN